MDDQTKEKIKQLTLAYGEQLPQKENELNDSWLRFQEEPSQEQLNLLTRQAHTLAGTSGTYGYLLVSEVSKKLENLFQQLNVNSLSYEIIKKINILMQDLKQVVISKNEADYMCKLDFNFFAHNDIRTIYILQIPEVKDSTM